MTNQLTNVINALKSFPPEESGEFLIRVNEKGFMEFCEYLKAELPSDVPPTTVFNYINPVPIEFELSLPTQRVVHLLHDPNNLKDTLLPQYELSKILI